MTLRYRDGLATYGGVLEACDRLEKELSTKLSREQRLLFIEKGTVEGLLTVLQGRPIRVEVTYQSNLTRLTSLKDSLTGEVLIRAHTTINEENIPPQVARQLDAKQLGIGEVLVKFGVETRREILSLGYEPSTKAFFREYEIIANGKVWFTITESFGRSLYAPPPQQT